MTVNLFDCFPSHMLRQPIIFKLVGTRLTSAVWIWLAVADFELRSYYLLLLVRFSFLLNENDGQGRLPCPPSPFLIIYLASFQSDLFPFSFVVAQPNFVTSLMMDIT